MRRGTPRRRAGRIRALVACGSRLHRPIDPVRKLLNKLLAPTGYRIERISRFERELQSLVRRPERRLKFVQIGANDGMRSEERRVGKGCRSRDAQKRARESEKVQ